MVPLVRFLSFLNTDIAECVISFVNILLLEMATGALALLTGYKSGRVKRIQKGLFPCRYCRQTFRANQGRGYHEKFCVKKPLEDRKEHLENELASM